MTTSSPERQPGAGPDRPRRRTDRIGNRLRRAAGQVGGVLAMYEDGRHPAELLDQIAAARAALDAAALLVFDTYATACTRHAATGDDAERVIADLTGALRRFIRKR